MTFSVFICREEEKRAPLLEWACKGFWRRAIENFICPEHDNQVVFANIGNIMRPPRYCFDNLRLTRRRNNFMRLTREHVPEPEMGCSSDHEELLRFRMVVVATAGNAGPSRKK